MHILITVLPEFTDKSVKARYMYKNEEIQGTFAPSALYPKLRPDHILALCTKEAREPHKDCNRSAVDVLREEVGEGRVTVASIEVDWSLDQFLDSASKALDSLVNGSKEAKISVDFTHGPRQYAIMVYALSAYYCELHALEFSGAYSCQYVKDAAGPVYDLSDFSRLQQWLGAVKKFNQGGNLSEILQLIKAQGGEKNLLTALDKIESALRFGLPIEAGKAAQEFIDEQSNQLYRAIKNLPQSLILRDQIIHTIKDFSLELIDTKNWKKSSLSLTEKELIRQRALIARNLEAGNYSLAMALMSEWIVSVLTNRFEKKWLNPKERTRAARRLGNLTYYLKKRPQLLSDIAKPLADFWANLTDIRNAYAHCGMRPSNVNDTKDFGTKLSRVLELWHQFQNPDYLIRLLEQSEQTLQFNFEDLLICPVGLRAGIVYDFLRNFEIAGATKIVFIVSSRSADIAAKVVEKLRIPMSKIVNHSLDDVHGGTAIDALRQSVKSQLADLLADSRTVHINLTGGTTFMSYCCETLAVEAMKTAEVKRYMVIDRRSSEEQSTSPWEGAGQLVEIKSVEDDQGQG